MSEQESKKMSGCAKAGIGCGIALVILLIIGAIGVWWVAKNAKSLMSEGFASVINQAVEQSNLPDDQKQVITSRVDSVKEDFIAGDITLEQIGQAMENLDVEKLISAGVTQYVGTGMMNASNLSADQKAAGQQAMNRVATGLLDGQISTSEVQTAIAPILDQSASGDWQFKQNPTAEELQQVLENANDLADQAGIAQDVPEIDFGQRVSEAFDEALGTVQP
tara:strand:- start:158 stop:820 length:663 start_codon:yes stop_codon:yes gene_type:complete